MNISNILTIVFAIITVIISVISYYLYIRKKITEAATGAVNNAEDLPTDGEAKKTAAVDAIYSIIPVIVKPLFSKVFIAQIVQAAFDKIEAYAKKQIAKKTSAKSDDSKSDT